MHVFKPTIGKWNDLENYDIDEPNWRQVLELADRYRHTDDVRKIMQWITDRKIEINYRLCCIASYGLLNITGFNKQELTDIIFERHADEVAELTKMSSSLEEYAVNVLKKTNVPDEIIQEFKER